MENVFNWQSFIHIVVYPAILISVVLGSLCFWLLMIAKKRKFGKKEGG